MGRVAPSGLGAEGGIGVRGHHPGVATPGFMMSPRPGLEIRIARYTQIDRMDANLSDQPLTGPRKPRRIDPERHDTNTPRIRLEQGRGDRIEHEHSLGLIKRLAENPVILGRPDSSQGSFMLMQSARVMPAFRQTAMANLGRGKLEAKSGSQKRDRSNNGKPKAGQEAKSGTGPIMIREAISAGSAHSYPCIAPGSPPSFRG